jgi:DNA-binding LacI/PurR family transcriptional regulator
MPTLVTVPKFEQLAAILQDQVKDGTLKPGQKLPGERTLAQEYGVAHLTVNKAVAGLVAHGVFERRQGDGTYVCKPPPPSTVSQTLAIMVDTRAEMHDPFLFTLSPFLQARQLYPMLLHWESVLADPRPLEDLLRQRPAAFVANGRCGLPLKALANRHPATRLVVLGTVDRAISLPGSYILHDHEAAGRLAAEHLLETGCRRFLVLGPPEANGVDSVANDGFLQTACRVIAAAGGTRKVIGAAGMSAEDYGAIFRRPDYPDGIISLNDFRLMSALDAARDAGRDIPGEVRAVGQFNTPWAAAAGLSSVEMNVEGMLGQLTEILAGGEDRSVSLAPRLVCRRSTIGTSPQAVIGETS